MRVVITNAGYRGEAIAKELKENLSQDLKITNISTNGCWLEIGEWEYGRFRPIHGEGCTCEEYFPSGQVSFEIDSEDLDWMIRLFTTAFEGWNLQFSVPKLNFEWLIA